jgi:protein-tyrosine phosphatase
VVTALMVCTGNICRSPLMQLSLQRLAQQNGIPLAVSSAGTRALEGEAMPEHGLAVATELGLSGAEAHVARQLTPDLLSEADLVLVASAAHVTEVAIMHPASSGRVFTLRSFAHLVQRISPEEWPQGTVAERVHFATEQRGLLPYLPVDTELDIPDPYRRSLETYQRSAALISQATQALSPLFIPVSSQQSATPNSLSRQFGSVNARDSFDW